MGTLFGATTDPANGSSPDAAVVRNKLNHLVEQLQDHLMNWNDDPASSTPKADLRAPAGTVMVFHQGAAPALWTKIVDAARDNIALRLVTTTAFVAGASGADVFTTVFGTGKVSASHILAAGEIPAHDHGSGGAHTHNVESSTNEFAGTSNHLLENADVSANQAINAAASAGAHTHASFGGGGGHTHGLTLDLKHAMVILASKD